MDWKIPLFEIYWDKNDIKAVDKIIKSGANWAIGGIIKEFENELAKYFDVKHCLVMNSGTSAQTSILEAYNIKNKDEVIVPSFTFISTANCVLHTGAKPVFVDIEKENYGLDPNLVLENINSKTKAIVPVHYAGGSADIRALSEIAEDHNLILIEDNAEGFGAMIGNKKLGTFGNASFLSFCQNKIITTGEGGAVLSNDTKLIEKLEKIRSHGRQTKNYFGDNKSNSYVSLGYNYRMPSMNAALGLSQLKKVDKIIKMRRDIANNYNKELSKIENLKVQNVGLKGNHVFQLYSILLENKNIRDGLMNYLGTKSIFSKIYFEPVHKTYFYKNILNYDIDLPVTENISDRILSLPMHPMLKRKDQNFILKNIMDYFENTSS